MKKMAFLVLSVLLLVCLNSCGNQRNKTNQINDSITIEDTNFLDYLLNRCDYNADGRISKQEAKAVTSINCSYSHIQSLSGIEHFTSLKELDCSDNQLTDLDLSKNLELRILNCNNNKLTSLSVCNNVNLQELHCGNNELTSLDISQLTALEEIFCFDNKLNSLDVSKNERLKIISCFGNELSNIDISNNTNLEQFSCRNNQIANIDVSHNEKLTLLYCSNNHISNLNLSKCPNLEDLDCEDNQIISLDLKKCSKLSNLKCRNNKLNTLKICDDLFLTPLVKGNNIPMEVQYKLLKEYEHARIYVGSGDDGEGGVCDWVFELNEKTMKASVDIGGNVSRQILRWEDTPFGPRIGPDRDDFYYVITPSGRLYLQRENITLPLMFLKRNRGFIGF